MFLQCFSKHPQTRYIRKRLDDKMLNKLLNTHAWLFDEATNTQKARVCFVRIYIIFITQQIESQFYDAKRYTLPTYTIHVYLAACLCHTWSVCVTWNADFRRFCVEVVSYYYDAYGLFHVCRYYASSWKLMYIVVIYFNVVEQPARNKHQFVLLKHKISL